MDKIYLIQEVNFDNSENTISDAISIETLGFVYLQTEAEELVKKLQKENRRYESWEGVLDKKEHWYPKFNIEEVDKLLILDGRIL